MSVLTIRLAREADDGTLRRLAALDDARPLRGRALLAESDGVPVAAVSLESGAAVADPFAHSADAVRVLMLRRYQLVRQSGSRTPARQVLRRLIPRPVH